MKEKIIETISQKIAQAFEEFIPHSTYQPELDDFEKIIKNSYWEYKALLNQQGELVTNIKREEYILRQIQTDYWHEYQKKDPIEALQNKYPEAYKDMCDRYNRCFEEGRYFNSPVVVTFMEFLLKYKVEDYEDNMLIQEILKYDFRIQQHGIISDEEVILQARQNVEQKYKEYWDTIENATRIISKITLSGLEEYYVNVGHRSYSGSGRQLVNKIIFYENGEQYPFTFYNDTEAIQGIFVNLYILSKKDIRKVSINDKGRIEDLTITIFKDVQQVRVKGNNIVEIQRHKHFNPEIIICKDEDEAFIIKDTINRPN